MTETLVQLGYGEIVSWRVPKECPYANIVSSLAQRSLPVSVARDLMPRNAFIRGVRSMEEKRIIKKLSDDKDEIKFQFNQIKDIGGQFDYPFEMEISLNKTTGTVSCNDYSLQSKVQQLLNLEMGRRTSGDITKIVQKLFEYGGSELVPIREQGGAYFVPASHVALADSIRDFLGDIGGSMRRFGGLSGEDTRQSLAESIGEHFEQLLAEFKDLIKNLNSDSTEQVRLRRSDQLEDLRSKLESYRDLLKLSAEEIDYQIDEAEAEMFRKLNELGTVTQAETQEPDSAAELLASLL